jgi:hypothetical protein
MGASSAAAAAVASAAPLPNLVKTLASPAADIPRCGVLCVDFDFGRNLKDCVVNIEPMFGTQVKTKQ